MKVMTFNVQHFLDWSNKRIDIALFADFIKSCDVDICGLNEVRGEGPIDGYTDQTNALADRIGYERFFGEAIKVRGSSPYGNAIISRLPLKSADTIKIPDPLIKIGGRYESRCIVKAVIDVNGKDVMFLVCHMGLMRSERKNAVKTICRLLDECSLPCILMGDFNTKSDDKVLDPIYERMRDTDALSSEHNMPTYPSYKPESKIDYIFFRNMSCVGVKTLTDVVSDHFPIIAEFRI